MRGKPHPWGFKIWCRTGVKGILYDFDVYQGSTAGKRNKSEFGVAANVVLNLCSTLPDQQQQKIYADNFFTSVPLLQKLAERGIQYVGTVRGNRLKNCLLQEEKVLKKKGRGSYDWKVENGSNIIAVKWCDTRAVTSLSTFVGISPVDQVIRWNKTEKKYITIERPFIVKDYNESMGGVDLLDSYLAKYKYQMKSKRWYMYLFWQTIKISLVNAWLLYRRDCSLLGIASKKIMNQRKFQAQVATSLILVNTGVKRTGRTLSSSPSLVPLSSPTAAKQIPRQPTVDVQKDQFAHWPIKCNKRGRCKLCKDNKTDTFCEKCEVRLCFTEQHNCFKHYHV